MGAGSYVLVLVYKSGAVVPRRGGPDGQILGGEGERTAVQQVGHGQLLCPPAATAAQGGAPERLKHAAGGRGRRGG